MHFTSTYGTNGPDIGNSKKLGARKKSRTEPTRWPDKEEPPRPSEHGGWKRSSVLPEKEPNERGKQQKLRWRGKWKRNGQRESRARKDEGRGKLHEERRKNKSRRQKRGYAERKKGKQRRGRKKQQGEPRSSWNEWHRSD